METVRIQLGEGYADVLKEMTHKTAKAVDAVLRKHNKSKTELIKQIQEFQSKKIDEVPQEISVIFNDNTEAILLNQVKSWSFGEVNQETLDNLSATTYQLLATEVDKLYSVNPLAPSN